MNSTTRLSLSVVSLGALCVACARPTVTRSDTAQAEANAERKQAASARAERAAAVPVAPPASRPAAIVDLQTPVGAALVRAKWRYSDVRIRQVESRGPGADLRPSGEQVLAYDYEPKASDPAFDDSAWVSVDPADLEHRRGQGKLSFGWYRLELDLPERIGDISIHGATVAFEIVVDDYAEIWVDGRLERRLGDAGGGVVAGFNVPNRAILTRDARAGQRFTLAVFAMNGPVSAVPENFLWVRSATLEVHPKPAQAARGADVGSIERRDPAIGTVFEEGVRVEKLAAGFEFTEGPVWNPLEGSLFFSDPNQNTIYRYHPHDAISVFRSKSGYKGVDVGRYKQPGSNGLALDAEGRITINEHGNRRVTRLEPTGQLTVLADSYQGKRLNSPNDLVYRSDGSLYFTDPPFGLPHAFDDPAKELAFSGVYRWRSGELTLVSRELHGPNGLAFSPEEKHLYVANWDVSRKVVMRFPVEADGMLGPGSVFFDMTAAPGEEALDGLKVDAAGNVFVSGPGGVWVLSKEGKHLGTLRVAELPANFAWGDADRRSLYMTARTGLYRVRTKVPGAGAFLR